MDMAMDMGMELDLAWRHCGEQNFGDGDELKEEFQANPMRNYKLCRASPKWALRKLLAN